MLKKLFFILVLSLGVSGILNACSGTFYVCNMEEFSQLRSQLLNSCEDDDTVNIHFIDCNVRGNQR